MFRYKPHISKALPLYKKRLLPYRLMLENEIEHYIYYIIKYFTTTHCWNPIFSVQVSTLSSQVSKLQDTLSSLQQETEQTINKLRQELADKVSCKSIEPFYQFLIWLWNVIVGNVGILNSYWFGKFMTNCTRNHPSVESGGILYPPFWYYNRKIVCTGYSFMNFLLYILEVSNNRLRCIENL